jgi:hypothetical protein
MKPSDGEQPRRRRFSATDGGAAAAVAAARRPFVRQSSLNDKRRRGGHEGELELADVLLRDGYQNLIANQVVGSNLVWGRRARIRRLRRAYFLLLPLLAAAPRRPR